MVYFRRYASSRPRGFLLVSFQKMKQNEKKGKKESYKKNQVMEMKIKTKLKQNENKNKVNKVKK